MFGQSTLTNNSVLPTHVLAGGDPQFKPGGITIDWTSVAAASGNQTLPDGSVILDGQKFLRYGQILCRIGVAEVQTYTLTGGPTGGSATLTFAATASYALETFAIGATDSAATVQATLQALNRVGVNGVTVARSGAGSAGDPYIYTATFNKSGGDITTPTQTTNALTGGTTPTTTIATGTPAGSTAGKYGPYDPSATDGRATLARGECYILDETVLQYPAGTSLISGSTDHYGSCLEGGLLWRDRVLHSGAQTHTLARGPTLAEVEAAFPSVRWVASQT
jgi:hypothetical protein